MALTGPLLYLLSGTVLNTLSQLITDTAFSAPEAHIIPAVKFTATLIGAALRRPKRATATPQQRRLMAAIGLLDASAYTVFCLGFYACGATLANLLLSGVGQVLTATLTRLVLRRRLSGGQLAGIACVGLGLAVRAAPAAYFTSGSSIGTAGAGASLAAGLSPEQLGGAALVALAALLYSLLGVAYEKLLKGSQQAPPNAEIMWQTSILGFLASAAYQVVYTLPNYDRLVGQPLAASPASPATVAGLLLLFGTLFNLHTVLQAAVFKSDGAIGVGLVNAVRGAAITVVIAALFCGPGKQHLCLTRQTVLSAAITTTGGAVYVLTGGQPRPAAVRKTGTPAAAAAAAGAAAAGAPSEKDKAA